MVAGRKHWQTGLGLFYNLIFQAVGTGNEFLFFLFRHLEMFQCSYCMGDKYLPFPSSYIEARMSSLHTASPVDYGPAGCFTQKVDKKLPVPFHAIGAVPSPIKTDVRIAGHSLQ